MTDDEPREIPLPEPLPPKRSDGGETYKRVEQERKVFGKPTPQRKRCGAQKENGELCKGWAVRGRERCKFHGGASPAPGPLHPSWKDGKNSKAFQPVAELVNETLQKGGLLDLEESLAHLAAARQRITELVDERDTPEYRRRLRTLMKEYKNAERDGMTDLAAEHLENMFDLIGKGADEAEAVREWRASAKDVVLGQSKAWNTILSAQATMTIPSAVVMIQRIVGIVQQEAPESIAKTIIRRIGIEILGAMKSNPASQLPDTSQ